MAKKAELLEKAKKLKLDVSAKNTIAEIEAAIESVDANTTKNYESKDKSTVAKAGKRSAKAIKEAEELEAKEQRKSQQAEQEKDTKPKVQQNPPKPHSERKSKKYKEVVKLVDKTKEYVLKEAMDLAIKTNTTKFDSTVELHINLGVDPKHADQNIRGTIVLPAGTGKVSRVAVFADDENVKKAKDAGADIAAGDEFMQKLDKNELDFDVLISTPQTMPKLGKYARILGPKGLMPNPKSGTVTNDVTKAVKQAKAGQVEYRVDSSGIVHVGIGKTSFKVDDLVKNTQTVLSQIKSSRPASLKGVYIRNIFVTTTMGPSIKLTLTEI